MRISFCTPFSQAQSAPNIRKQANAQNSSVSYYGGHFILGTPQNGLDVDVAAAKHSHVELSILCITNAVSYIEPHVVGGFQNRLTSMTGF